ncbi:MAG: proton-conducting transporter membrane subunit [Pseudomonadota bacterium]
MSALLSGINPGFVLIVLGLVACFTPVQRVRNILSVGAPLAGLALLMMAERGVALSTASVLSTELTLYYVDSLNFIFGLGFLLLAFLHAIYGMHRDDRLHEGAVLIFAGSAVAAVFAGDLMSLFIFWEIGTAAAAFLILRAGTKAAYQAGMRFLGFHILSGVLFLDGLIYVYKKSGGFSFAEAGLFDSFSGSAAKYIFAALAIKAAFPLVHTWLKDVTSKMTVIGGVVLPLFTTVLAVYGFARLFPGFDVLVWIGAIMAAYAVVFAAIVGDARRALGYGQNALSGLMICAVGIGTPLAINAAAGLAFMSLIVIGLLSMAVGAVVYSAGSAKFSALGGLWRSMPLTALFALIGAVSLSGLPLFLGGVTLPMVLSVVAGGSSLAVQIGVLIGVAGLVYALCLRLPLTVFFGEDSRERPAEAPFNMVLAMGLSALVCVLLALPKIFPGLGYDWLYSLLPCSAAATDPASCTVTTVSLTGFEPYSSAHMLPVLQVTFGAALAFLVMRRIGLFRGGASGVVLDTDWLYRKWGYGVAKWSGQVWQKIGPALSGVAGALSGRVFSRLEETFSPRGALARTGLNSGAAIWSAVLLGVVMMVVLLSS